MRHGIHTNEHLVSQPSASTAYCLLPAKANLRDRQPFHNDMGADILALQVRECAEEGGHTFVASAGKIVCELALRRPDVIETLSRADWPIQVLVSFDPLLSSPSHTLPSAHDTA